jgi:hypothetical protein
MSESSLRDLPAATMTEANRGRGLQLEYFIATPSTCLELAELGRRETPQW